MDVVTGGIGLSYDASANNLFAGAYHGSSLPGPRSYISSGESLDEESSMSYELGFRYQVEAFVATGALFYSDLQDFIVPDNLVLALKSSKAEKQSIRITVRTTVKSPPLDWNLHIGYDFGIAKDAGYNLPVTVGLTWTEAEFESGARSADGESIFSGAKDGNEVPYIPEIQLHAGIAYATGKYRCS